MNHRECNRYRLRLGCDEESLRRLESLTFERETAMANLEKASVAGMKRREQRRDKERENKSVKPQELTGLAADINQFRNQVAFEKIKDTPRLICTDSELPTTLQEGCRYNALHVAARVGNTEVIQFVLNSISSMKFMRKLYPTDDEDILLERISKIFDAYLNTPDKIGHDTPLHFACKFTHYDSAKLLLSHPWCQTEQPNASNSTPYQVIGCRSRSIGNAVEIRKLFEDRYIVPIWRDIDNLNPIVGQPLHMTDLRSMTPKPLLSNFPEFPVSLLGTFDVEISQKRNPRDASSSWNTAGSGLKIAAYSGPCSRVVAVEILEGLKETSVRFMNTRFGAFIKTPSGVERLDGPDTKRPERRQLTSTPAPHLKAEIDAESIKSPLSSILFALKSPHSPIFVPRRIKHKRSSSSVEDQSLRAKDPTKGLERIARKITRELDIPWNEYWAFLNDFEDFGCPPGLERLESLLQTVEQDYLMQDYYDFSEVSTPSTCESLLENKVNDYRKISPAQNIPDKLFEAKDSLSSSNSDSEDEMLDCFGDMVYLNGKLFPGDEDTKVFNVIKESGVTLEYTKYPLLFQWYNSIMSQSAVVNQRKCMYLDDKQIESCTNRLRNLRL